MERAVQYVRGSFWAGEAFADLADAQARVEVWCRERAGMRIHGTTAQRPAEMFTELEAGCLLPVPEPYDQPVFTRVKVHRDHHVEVARALYSVPEHSLRDARLQVIGALGLPQVWPRHLLRPVPEDNEEVFQASPGDGEPDRALP